MAKETYRQFEQRFLCLHFLYCFASCGYPFSFFFLRVFPAGLLPSHLCAKPWVILHGQDACVPIQLRFLGFDSVGSGIVFSGIVVACLFLPSPLS